MLRQGHKQHHHNYFNAIYEAMAEKRNAKQSVEELGGELEDVMGLKWSVPVFSLMFVIFL